MPPNKIAQEIHYGILESSNGMNREDRLRLRSIYRKSGIQSRYSVLSEFGKTDSKSNLVFHPALDISPIPISGRMDLFEYFAGDLSEKAVVECFSQLPGLSVGEITHIVTFSCTGMFAPGLDIQLVERLKLKRNVERTAVNFMGCYAGVIALKTAYHIARSEPDAVVLIVGAELCTLHYQKSMDQDQMVANAIFSDGCAAAVISSKDLNPDRNTVTFGMNTFYSEFEPSGREDMAWRIGENGFNLRLSSFVPELIENNIDSLTRKLLSRAEISTDDIDYYALHPGGVKILEACEKALGITHQQNAISYHVLKEYGNMSSVTILFVLKEFMFNLTRKQTGKKMLVCAFGPGLTMEAMVTEIS